MEHGGTGWSQLPRRAGTAHLQHNAATAKPVRVLSSGGALPLPPTSQLEQQLGNKELRVLEVLLTPQMDTPPSEVGALEAFVWVHIAATFKELATAKRLGAVTVWFNEQAAATQKDVGDIADNLDMGFLSAAIISDFADAVCGSAGDVAGCVLEAQRVAIEKEEKENQRFLRETERQLAEAEKMRPVRWDAVASDEQEDPSSPFAKPAEQLPEPFWKQSMMPPAPPPPPAPSVPADATAGSSKFCILCGVKLPLVAKFCSQCGAKQVEVE